MKKWLTWALVLIGLIVAGGDAVAQSGHSQTNYDQYVDIGQRMLTSRHYLAAETMFNRAVQASPGSGRARRDLSRTQNYVAGNRSLAARNFAVARIDFSRSRGSRSVLNARAKVQLAKIKQINKRIAEVTKAYNEAVALNHRSRYAKSNRILKLARSYRLGGLQGGLKSQMSSLHRTNDRVLRLRRRSV